MTYIHLKTQGIYNVLHHGHLEATMESVVIYQSVSSGIIFVRPETEFYDGRFALIEDQDPFLIKPEERIVAKSDEGPKLSMADIRNAREVVIDGKVVKSHMAPIPEPFDPVTDIEEFHKKYGIEYNGKPRALTGELFQFRIGFLKEELQEYHHHAYSAAIEATRTLTPKDPANYAYHLEECLDALVDLVYVAVGTAHLHGFNFREAWRRVHEANMKKVRAERKEDSKRGTTFDVVKPDGWEPPSHIDLVEINDLMDVRTNEG